jgi:hypothetical protein
MILTYSLCGEIFFINHPCIKYTNKEDEILETLKVIMGRIDDIEEKINDLYDSCDFNNYFKLKNTMPDGYTLIDTTGTSDTCRNTWSIHG